MNAKDEDEIVSTFDAYELDELESYDLEEVLPPNILGQIRNHDFEPIGFD